MNKLALVAVPLSVLAGAACAVPWYVGMQTEEAMRAQVAALAGNAQFPLNVVFTRYERGWLSSTAMSRLTFKAEPRMYLEVHHDISHVPDTQAGWVHVRSVPHWDASLKSTLDYYFDGKPAITVDTVIGFDGSRRTVFASPAFSKPLQNLPDAKLSWGGLQGQAALNADKRLVASASMPHFGMQGGDNEAGLDTLKLDADWDVRGTATDWQGETKLALGQVHFSGAQEKLALNDVSAAAYQRAKGDTVLIGYVLHVGSGSSTQSGKAEQAFSNAVLDLEFDQINKKALAKYFNDLGNAENPGGSAAHNPAAAQLWMELAGDLLRGSPVIRLKQLGVQTPAGAVSAQATVTFDGSNLTAIQMSPELLNRLQAKGNLEISGTLLRAQLQRKMRPQIEVALVQQGGESTEERIRALSEKLTEDQLKSLTDNGLLRANGASFTVEAEFAGGLMLVNGQPANQLFGAMMMMPPVPAQPPVPEAEALAQPNAPVSVAQRPATRALVPPPVR
jgi:uncharacterized protein YdgA (DUF945 family)